MMQSTIRLSTAKVQCILSPNMAPVRHGLISPYTYRETPFLQPTVTNLIELVHNRKIPLPVSTGSYTVISFGGLLQIDFTLTSICVSMLPL